MIFKGKKGFSILLYGVVFFAAMALLYYMTTVTVNHLKFQEYAGDDAQELTRMNYMIDQGQFLIDSYADQFLYENAKQFLYKNYNRYFFKDLKSNNKYTFTSNNYLQIESTSIKYYDDLKYDYYSWIEKKFNDDFLDMTLDYNVYLSSNSQYISQDHFDIFRGKNHFNLIFEENTLYGFSETKKGVEINGNEMYSFLHFTINNYDNHFQETFDSIIQLRLDTEKCLMDNNNVTLCADKIKKDNQLKDTQYKLEEDQTNNLFKLYININNFPVMMEFN